MRPSRSIDLWTFGPEEKVRHRTNSAVRKSETSNKLMPLVLAYDIPDDKRRERLRRTLLGFGTPVQYSVFECDLTPRQVERMRKAVREVIKLPEDNVRYYQLCRGCVGGVEVFGGRPLTQRRSVYVI